MNTPHPSTDVEEQVAKCSICLFGDGKWDTGRDLTGCNHLPVCDKCAADGWKVATSDDILKDPILRDVINHKL